MKSIMCSLLMLCIFFLPGCKKDNSVETPTDTGQSFTDIRDGKTYKMVTIGTQTWMAENLNYDTSSGCWYYKDDPANGPKFGRLYDWRTAMRVAPAGWHLPTETEWRTLFTAVGGSGSKAYAALMPTGTSGFNAQLGGCRYWSSRMYQGLTAYGFYWSSTPSDTFPDASVWYCDLSGMNAYLSSGGNYDGKSVRCIKD